MSPATAGHDLILVIDDEPPIRRVVRSAVELDCSWRGSGEGSPRSSTTTGETDVLNTLSEAKGQPSPSLRIPGLEFVERRHSRILQQPLAAPRGGIMLHYDDSTRDDWAVEWFGDPRCTNGYTWLVLDDGRVIELADPAYRTPHAGPCLTPKANSVFYGIAAATNGLVPATDAQLESIATVCAAVARFEGWSRESLPERIVGHDAEAIWTPDYTPDRALWGKLGRKVDPTGIRADKRPIIDPVVVCDRVIQEATDWPSSK